MGQWDPARTFQQFDHLVVHAGADEFDDVVLRADVERFRADERAYIDEWKLTPEQKDALLKRDYNRLLDLGGNVYFLAKVFSTDGQSFAQAVSTMTDMNFEDYTKMMVAGGRSPEGNRSIKEGR